VKSPQCNVVELRNAADHGDEVDWSDLRKLREYLLGQGAELGLFGRVLAESTDPRGTAP